MSSDLGDHGLPPLKPSKDLNVINQRLQEFKRNPNIILVGAGVQSLVKMDSLPEHYEIAWHAFRFKPLDPLDQRSKSPHVYHDSGWDPGVVALKREALLELWMSADGKHLHSERTDNGIDPYFVRYTWAGSVRSISTGVAVPAAQTKEIDLRDNSPLAKGMKDGMLRRQRTDINQICEAKSQNRVIRQLLGIPHTFQNSQIANSVFILMKLVFRPDMNDPLAKMLALMNGFEAMNSVWGGPAGGELARAILGSATATESKPQLTAGTPQAQLSQGTPPPNEYDDPDDSAYEEPPPFEETPKKEESEVEENPAAILRINSIADYLQLETGELVAPKALVVALTDLYARNPGKINLTAGIDTLKPGWRRAFVEKLLAPAKDGKK